MNFLEWLHRQHMGSLKDEKKSEGKNSNPEFYRLDRRGHGQGGCTQPQTLLFSFSWSSFLIEPLKMSNSSAVLPLWITPLEISTRDSPVMSASLCAELQTRLSTPTGLTHLLAPLPRPTRRVENGLPGRHWLHWASWTSRSPGHSRCEGTTRTIWVLRLLSVCWHSVQWTRIHRYTEHCLGPACYYITCKTKCMQTNE